MWLGRLFNGRNKAGAEERQEDSDSNINRGVAYLYLILILQVLLVFGIAGGIMVVGTVMATPLWVFLFTAGLAAWGCVYVYRKAMQQLRKIRDAFTNMNVSDRNYEISFMGGVVTMRVEQNTQRLLEAPPSAGAILDAEPVEAAATSSMSSTQ